MGENTDGKKLTYLSDDSEESYRSAQRFFRKSSISCKSKVVMAAVPMGIGGGGGNNRFLSVMVDNPT